MRCLSARALRSFISLPVSLCVTLLFAGCGMAPGQNGITTASLRPRPAEPLLAKPYSSYAPASTVGAAMPARPAAASQQAMAAAPPRTFKTYQYQWNGNRERIKEGASTVATPSAPTASATKHNAGLLWKTSQPAPPASKSGTRDKPPKPPLDIVVAPGDTLFSLSTKHNVPMASLMQVNHMTSPIIRVSQHLVLPAASR